MQKNAKKHRIQVADFWDDVLNNWRADPQMRYCQRFYVGGVKAIKAKSTLPPTLKHLSVIFAVKYVNHAL